LERGERSGDEEAQDKKKRKLKKTAIQKDLTPREEEGARSGGSVGFRKQKNKSNEWINEKKGAGRETKNNTSCFCKSALHNSSFPFRLLFSFLLVFFFF
jgi:hypothetical protein